ncbi:hypothetical protein B0O99DRAFT_745522 [Bisporella sp. PMI_857]|nr:hypothetical protein B0O99DRAFT_745522 [Bisporella sp. PMI_857]
MLGEGSVPQSQASCHPCKVPRQQDSKYKRMGSPSPEFEGSCNLLPIRVTPRFDFTTNFFNSICYHPATAAIMHSPSPSPSPSSSASLFEGLSPNEALNHVTHHGFAEARPFIGKKGLSTATWATTAALPSAPQTAPPTTTGLQNKDFPAFDHNATGSGLPIDTGTADQAPSTNSLIVNQNEFQNESYGPALDGVISWPVNNSAIIMPQIVGSQELPITFTPISGASSAEGISVNDPNNWWVNKLVSRPYAGDPAPIVFQRLPYNDGPATAQHQHLPIRVLGPNATDAGSGPAASQLLYPLSCKLYSSQ